MYQHSLLALTLAVATTTFSGLQRWASDATDPETVLVNVALVRPAWQSSNMWGRGASLANDGNNNSNAETAGSCNVMGYSTQAWWAVDVGAVVEVQKVAITQRSKFQAALGDFIIGATDTSPLVKAPSALASSEYDLCGTRTGEIPVSTTETFTCPLDSVSGRYVFVLKTTTPAFGFQLCEVEVFAAEPKINAALGRPAFQSSIDSGLGPSLAVDGNRNPNVEKVGSCSATQNTPKPWWAVDLGKVFTIQEVSISQRDQDEDSLADFVVAATDVSPSTTSPADLAASDYELCGTQTGPIPFSTTKTFVCTSTHLSGRYVFILSQGPDTKLQLCEVEVVVSHPTTESSTVGQSAETTDMTTDDKMSTTSGLAKTTSAMCNDSKNIDQTLVIGLATLSGVLAVGLVISVLAHIKNAVGPVPDN